jgi:hypothetical protein
VHHVTARWLLVACGRCLCPLGGYVTRPPNRGSLILLSNRWQGQGTGKAAGGGGEKGKRRKEQRTELTKRDSLTEDTPRNAATNSLRLHLHNFAYKTFKIKLS